jgi:2-amino-4-hydroxy-6-hydroxymethyldihydropteridine diphosphokinase
MVTAYIALGSNLGPREETLRAAIAQIAREIGPVNAVSTFRETVPVDAPPHSPLFVNAVASVETELPASELMQRLLEIERALGRDRSGAGRGETTRNAPRPIDLDLLLFGDAVLNEEGLTVPHPRMHQRRFVLEPLAEIAPLVRHPVLGETIESLLKKAFNENPKTSGKDPA